MRTLYKLLFIICVLMLVLPARVLSQNEKYHYAKKQTEIISASNTVIDSFDRLIEGYQKANDIDKMINTLLKKNDAYIQMGQTDVAEKNYLIALQQTEQYGKDSLGFMAIQALNVIYDIKGEFKKRHEIALRGVPKALKTGNPSFIMHIYTNLASDYGQMGFQDSVRFYFKKALSYSNLAEPEFLKNLYGDLGSYYYNKGDYEGGLSYFLKSVDICVSLGDAAPFLPNQLNHVAQTFIKLKNYDKAEQYATQAYQLCIKNNLKILRVQIVNSLADIKLYRGDTTGAITIYKETLALFENTANKLYIKTLSERLANIHVLKGELKTAFALLKTATQYNDAAQSAAENYYQQIVWSNYFLKKGQPLEAIKRTEGVLKDAQSKGLTNYYASLYQLLYKAYAQNGQYHLALKNLENCNRVTDSINEKSRAEVMMAIESRYELKEKNQTIIELNGEAKINETRMKTSKQWQGILVLGFILSSLLGGLAFYYYQITCKHTIELEQQNALISRAYAEKDLLLREIHHRVKNNLQVVSSLLRLQSRHVQDNQAQEALLESRNRVNSMALIHQYLYQEEDITKISADEYIEKLVTTLYKSYNVSDKRIQFKANIEPLKLDVDTAIPLGLILNELITNALKHAFPDKKEGTLIVTLLRGGNDTIHLSVQDNGIGFDEKRLKQAKESFGWSLIELFSEKLNGHLSITNGVGTTVHLAFSN
jgi:two-component system, sensor histidine kinase PdtaS